MYKLLDNVDAKLGEVTPLTLKTLKSLGYLKVEGMSIEDLDFLKTVIKEGGDEFDTQKALDILNEKPPINEIEIYMDRDRLIEVIEAVFICDIQKIKDNWQSVKVKNVIKGVYDILGELQPSTARFPSLSEILNNLKPQNQS